MTSILLVKDVLADPDDDFPTELGGEPDEY